MSIRTINGGGGTTDYNSLNNKPDLTLKVPYTGATGDLNLGIHNLDVNNIQLDTNPVVGVFSEGKFYYDITNKTISAMIDTNVTMQLGQEELVLCYNNTGLDIQNGMLVYKSGAIGDTPTIALAQANSEVTSQVLGMTTQLIANGATGFVTDRGIVHSINTSGFIQGDWLYLSPSVSGEATKIPTTDPLEFLVKIGMALLISPTDGSIYIKVTSNNRLTDLSDVTISSPTVDQILTWNGTEWINGNQRAISAGAGVSFYLDSTAIIPSTTQSFGIESLNKSPSTGIEEIESVIVNNSVALIDRYLYDTALNRTKIDAGAWTFNTFGYVSSNIGFSSIPVSVYKVVLGTGTLTVGSGTTSRVATITGGTPFVLGDANADITLSGHIQTPTAILRITGFISSSQVTVETLSTYISEVGVSYSVHKYLFTDANTEVNSESVGLITSKSVQPEFTANTTDKISISYFGKTTANSNRTLYLYHGGISNYTYFETPLAVLHNELAGLQGGVNGERYHLSLAEKTVVANTSGTNTGNQDLSGLIPYTGSTSDVDLGLHSIKTGGRKQAVAIKSLSYNLNGHDEVVVFTASSPALLPSATGSGQTYRIVSRNCTVTITPNGTDLIRGNPSQILTGYSDIILTDVIVGEWL